MNYHPNHEKIVCEYSKWISGKIAYLCLYRDECGLKRDLGSALPYCGRELDERKARDIKANSELERRARFLLHAVRNSQQV